MSETMEALKDRMQKLLAGTAREVDLIGEVPTEDRQSTGHSDAEAFEPWMLREWRRISIPDWRRILQDSIAQSDDRREAYARWMLTEVLLDFEYLDGTHEK